MCNDFTGFFNNRIMGGGGEKKGKKDHKVLKYAGNWIWSLSTRSATSKQVSNLPEIINSLVLKLGLES
jgi:hypothetical protein